MSDLRHKLVCAVADAHLKQMSDWDILKRCPFYYDQTVTYDHLNFVWDRLYDQYNKYFLPVLILTYFFRRTL